MIIRRTWVMAADRNFTFKIAAKQKPLQIETRLLFAVYINVIAQYPTVLSPTPYNVLFSHNTCVTDRRQSDDTSYSRLVLMADQKFVKKTFCVYLTRLDILIHYRLIFSSRETRIRNVYELVLKASFSSPGLWAQAAG